jgi:hypothetical protein
LIIIVTPKKIEKVKFPTIFAGFYCSIFLGRLLTRPFIGPSSLFQRGPNLGNQGICGLLAVSQKHLLPAKRRVFFGGVVKLSKIWVCLKIVYPYTQWLMIIIPTKWL